MVKDIEGSVHFTEALLHILELWVLEQPGFITMIILHHLRVPSIA